MLPGLAPRLPLPVPVPELIGHGRRTGTRGRSGAPGWCPASSSPTRGCPTTAATRLAAQVGGFLRALHDPVVARDLGGTAPPRPDAPRHAEHPRADGP